MDYTPYLDDAMTQVIGNRPYLEDVRERARQKAAKKFQKEMIKTTYPYMEAQTRYAYGDPQGTLKDPEGFGLIKARGAGLIKARGAALCTARGMDEALQAKMMKKMAKLRAKKALGKIFKYRSANPDQEYRNPEELLVLTKKFKKLRKMKKLAKAVKPEYIVRDKRFDEFCKERKLAKVMKALNGKPMKTLPPMLPEASGLLTGRGLITGRALDKNLSKIAGYVRDLYGDEIDGSGAGVGALVAGIAVPLIIDGVKWLGKKIGKRLQKKRAMAALKVPKVPPKTMPAAINTAYKSTQEALEATYPDLKPQITEFMVKHAEKFLNGLPGANSKVIGGLAVGDFLGAIAPEPFAREYAALDARPAGGDLLATALAVLNNAEIRKMLTAAALYVLPIVFKKLKNFVNSKILKKDGKTPDAATLAAEKLVADAEDTSVFDLADQIVSGKKPDTKKPKPAKEKKPAKEEEKKPSVFRSAKASGGETADVPDIEEIDAVAMPKESVPEITEETVAPMSMKLSSTFMNPHLSGSTTADAFRFSGDRAALVYNMAKKI